MAFQRTALPFFALANSLYASATVTIWVADSAGAKTTTRATLYTATTGTATIANPVTLNAEGRFETPPFIDDLVIVEVTDASVSDHETAVFRPGLSDTDVTAAASSATDAQTAQTAAEAAQALAEAAVTNAATEVTYAAQWADRAEDSLVEVAAGGNGVDDYSALHHAAKAQASATAAAAAVGAVRVSSNDTTPSDLEAKILAGTGITASTQNDGGNETRTFAVDDATHKSYAVTTGAAYALSI